MKKKNANFRDLSDRSFLTTAKMSIYADDRVGIVPRSRWAETQMRETRKRGLSRGPGD